MYHILWNRVKTETLRGKVRSPNAKLLAGTIESQDSSKKSEFGDRGILMY
ncbi:MULTISPECIES: hypothetical protein [unclassified Chamaesiphon]|nr:MULTISPECIES: hypothetical protein [unclassified Chamaesiphon]